MTHQPPGPAAARKVTARASERLQRVSDAAYRARQELAGAAAPLDASRELRRALERAQRALQAVAALCDDEDTLDREVRHVATEWTYSYRDVARIEQLAQDERDGRESDALGYDELADDAADARGRAARSLTTYREALDAETAAIDRLPDADRERLAGHRETLADLRDR